MRVASGERLIGFVDSSFATAVTRGQSVYGKGVVSNLIGGQQRVSGYSVKGLHLGTDGAQRAVGVAVDLATKGVGFVAANAGRFDRASNLNALDTLSRVAMPAAELVGKVADSLEQGSGQLVRRVSGKRVPAQAVARRKLATSQRKAALARKQVTKTASRQVDKAVAESKKIGKSASAQVDQVVAKSRKLRKTAGAQVEQAVAQSQKATRTATRRVSKAVASTATRTSNAARRVARKAEAAAAAA